MQNKKNILSGLLIFAILNPLFAISTTQIDTIRNKEAIADTDSAIIEDFVSEAFSELLAKTDFSDVAALRNAIVSKSSSATASGEIMYGPKYLAALQKELADAFTKVNAMTESQRKTVLTINLLILTNDIGKIDISKAALNYLQSPITVIRYWAAKNFANTNVITQLNAGQEADRKNIAEKILNAAQAEQSSDILVIYAQSASGLKDTTGNDILTAIAQKRIDLYISWKVSDEMTEDSILKALVDRTKTDPDSTKVMARYFSSLLSVVIQRYALGQAILDDASKGYLVSIIVQGDKSVPTFVPEWSGNFKRAIDKDVASLLTESDALFGSAAVSGKLPTTIGFDYGKNPDGSAKTIPPTLTKPQAK